MSYIGIDYSGTGATCNRDAANGIRYGVISTHSLHEFFWDSVENDYGDPTCPDCGNPATDAATIDAEWAQDQNGEYACSHCETCFESDHAFPDEALGWSIDDGDYKVINCLDSDAMVILSPYYTYAQYCSPCVPGAGNLDNPCEDGVKCYCFGHEWFDGDRAPYPVYSVETGNQVIAEEQTTPCPNCNGTGRDSVQRLADARQDTCEHIREQITAGAINVRDYDDADSFKCFRCDGKGTQSETVTREVQS